MIHIDEIIRTHRKSIAIIIKRDGSLLVRAPLRASNAEINAMVEKNAHWIKAKKSLIASKYPQAVRKEFVNGEGFWYLGDYYRLKIIDSAQHDLKLDEVFLLDRSCVFDAPAVFIRWYRTQAHQIIAERVAWYAATLGINYKKVRITSAKHRWGSCSSTGTLSFPWRLVMAPMPVIDYVVVHELVHVSVKNHGKSFWAKVKTIIPDFKSKVEWLDIHGHLLNIE